MVFAALREHVVEVAEDFAAAVSERIDKYVEEGRFERPSIGQALARTALEVLNIAAAAWPSRNRKDDS